MTEYLSRWIQRLYYKRFGSSLTKGIRIDSGKDSEHFSGITINNFKIPTRIMPEYYRNAKPLFIELLIFFFQHQSVVQLLSNLI